MAGFTTEECAWSAVTVKILGRTVIGIRGFEIDFEVEKEHLHAAGDMPIDIQSGIVKPTGSFKMLKFEADLLNDAALAAGYLNITMVPHTLISSAIVFKKYPTSRARTIQVSGIAFTKLTYGMEQGAKMMEIQLPFLCMGITLV